jgi:hypothetical protein
MHHCRYRYLLSGPRASLSWSPRCYRGLAGNGRLTADRYGQVAMIYQHATRDRDQAIAKALGAFVKGTRGTKEEPTEAPERDEQGA